MVTCMRFLDFFVKVCIPNMRRGLYQKSQMAYFKGRKNLSLMLCYTNHEPIF